ncbi:MAG: hypothetical protein WCY58_10565 [Mariniphaga sp.]
MFFKAIRYLFIACVVFMAHVAFAQRDTSLIQEVEVVKSYQPTISDANKISSLPRIEDVEHEKPTFNYSIFSQPVFNTFSVNPLKAATFVSQVDRETGYGLVRAGLGNYNRPYGEVFFNSQNIRNTLFGLHGKHLSSHGKLKLEGGDWVKTPFSENQAEMFVKHLFRTSILSLNLGFDHNGFNYYGYPVESIPAELKNENQQINYLGSRQTFSKGLIHIGLKNEVARKNDFIFDFHFKYHYFGTKTGQREHLGEFMADLKKPYSNGTGFLQAGITFVRADSVLNMHHLAIGKSQQTWLTLKPSYLISGDIASIRFGLNSWFVIDSSDDMMAKIAPNLKMNFTPVKDVLNIFAGIDGNYIQNHYSKIAYENPFVDPYHHVKNTFERFRIFGGFDGKLAAKTNFKLSADYSVIRDQPFYYLFKYFIPGSASGRPLVDNDFDVIYDNLNRLKFNIEVFHASVEKLNLLLSGNYYLYDMESIDKAWNLPVWDAKLSIDYPVSDQLSVSTDLFLTGQRTGLILFVPSNDPRFPNPLTNAQLLNISNLQWESYDLTPVFDLNFGANYKLTSRFSLFARLNNFGFQKYQQWLGYPVQRFNLMGGLSYAF